MTAAAQAAMGAVARVRIASAGAAVAVVVLAAGTAVAQTIPYQSSMREQVGTGPGQQPLPRGGEFRPRIETAIQYVNNINLAEQASDEVNTYGIELTPGFYASYSSGTAIGAIDYSVIGRAWDDSDYNDVSQRGAANGSWTVVPNLFSLQGQASITDNVIDPARRSQLRRSWNLRTGQPEPAGDSQHLSRAAQALQRLRVPGAVLIRPGLVFRPGQRGRPGGVHRAGRLEGPELLHEPRHGRRRRAQAHRQPVLQLGAHRLRQRPAL